jgi:hypothetical protein
MKRIRVQPYRIRELWNLCDEGVFAVPEIQREFVQDPRRARDLMGSTSPLWLSDVRRAYRSFQKDRLKLICKAFENAAGTKLFKRE